MTNEIYEIADSISQYYLCIFPLLQEYQNILTFYTYQHNLISIDIDTNTPFSIISIQRKFDALLFDIMEQWKRNKTIPQISIYDDKSKYIDLISLLDD